MEEFKNGVDISQMVRGSGIRQRISVVTASTSNVNIASTDFVSVSIGGVTPSAGERVLLVGQSTGTENGIYIAVAGEGNSRRDNDLLTGDSAESIRVNVRAGNNAGYWKCTNTKGSDVVGTDVLTFKQFEVNTYSAGTFMYANSSNTLATLAPPGANDKYLTINASNVPSWGDIISSDLPSLQARRTTSLTISSTSFSDITFNVNDVENSPSILTHSTSSLTDNIDILETGLYLVSYSFSFDPDNTVATAEDDGVIIRVRVNDTTIINGSITQAGNHYSSANARGEFFHISKSFLVNLTAGQFITTQGAKLTQAGGSSIFTTTQDSIFIATRMRGIKGATGATGSGSNIIVKDEGVNVTNTPHSELNFVGTGVTVTDGGSGVATITIPTLPNYQYFSAYESGNFSTASTTFVVVTLASFTTTSLPAGTYLVQWYAEWVNDTNDKEGEIRLRNTTTSTVYAQNGSRHSRQDILPYETFAGGIQVSLSGANTIQFEARVRENNVLVRRTRLWLHRV